MSGMDKTSSPDLDRPPLSRRIKYLTTFAIYFGNMAYGCAFNTYGPALVDLRNKYEVETDAISVVFTVLTISLCFGALLSGFVYNFLNRQLGMVMLLVLMALSMFAAPLCPTMPLFFVSGALLGFTAGAYDSSQIVWMMEIWQHESGPFIQAQHFSYAVGSMIPSLVLAQFMSQELDDDEEGISTTTAQSTDNPTQKLIAPFFIVGALVTLAALIQLTLFLTSRYYPPPPEEGRLEALFTSDDGLESNNNGEVKGVQVVKRDFYRIKLIILTATFLGSYAGMEICTLQFFATFAQSINQDNTAGAYTVSKRAAAYTVTGVTGAFTVGRGLGIVAVLRFPPQLIICFNLVTLIAANIILLLFAETSMAWLWTGAILVGVGFSTTYPSFCAFIERHLLFTSWIGSIMLISGSIVASVYPLIIGSAIDSNPVVITYTSFFSIFLCVVALALSSFFVFNRQKQAKLLKMSQTNSK